MIQPISSSEFLAVDYPPNVVVVPRKVYPTAIRRVAYTQLHPNGEEISVAKITVQPYSTLFTAAELLDGFMDIGPTAQQGEEFLEFIVVAEGNDLTYQWKQNGHAISGATSGTLRISTLYNHATDMTAVNMFTVEITNRFGTVTSNPITFSVTNNYGYAPTIDSANLIQIPLTSVNMGDTVQVGNSGTFTTQYTPYATYTRNITFTLGSSSTTYNNVTTTTKSFVVPPLTISSGSVQTTLNAQMYVGSSSWDNGSTFSWSFNVNKYPVTETFTTVKNASLALLDSIFATNPVTSNLTTSNKLWIYSSISSLPSNPVATFNTNFWAYSRRDVLNFSGISFTPPGDSSGDQVNATLITPQHFISANHFAPPVGSTIYFYRHNDGVGVPAVVSTLRNLSGTDFVIGKLTNPVTDANIKIYPIVSQYSHYWYQDPQLPIFTFSGKRLTDDASKDYALGIFRTSTGNSQTLDTDFSCSPQSLSLLKTSYPNYTIGTVPDIGDSANPLFVYTASGLSLITTFYTNTSGPAIYGSAVSSFIDTSLALSSFNPNNYTVTRTSLGLPAIT